MNIFKVINIDVIKEIILDKNPFAHKLKQQSIAKFLIMKVKMIP